MFGVLFDNCNQQSRRYWLTWAIEGFSYGSMRHPVLKIWYYDVLCGSKMF